MKLGRDACNRGSRGNCLRPFIAKFYELMDALSFTALTPSAFDSPPPPPILLNAADVYGRGFP